MRTGKLGANGAPQFLQRPFAIGAFESPAADQRSASHVHLPALEQVLGRQRRNPAQITDFKEPVWDDNAVAEAWISGDFYEWTPHDPKREASIATTKAKAGEGWKQISVDFVSEKWGPFSDLAFRCSNSGTAYFDDFLYEEVKE